MKTITLPDELNLELSSAVQVFDYRSAQEISRQQIVLNKNTFSFLSEGKKEVVFDNSSFSIDHSAFLVMKSGHCLMTEKLSDVNKHYNSLLLFFSNDAVLNFIRKFELIEIEPHDYPSVYSFEYDEFITRFVKSLVDISKLSKAIQKKILEVKFEEIMLYLLELKGPAFLFSLISNGSDQTQKFTQTVESNQLNKLTVKELAFLCDMSVSTFKREFERHYSESPIKWFQEKRLEYAFYLLKQDQKRPSDVFFEAGYETLSSFIQAYKAKYGVSPKQHHKD
jgi:AraC-like DNA-binding protein